MQLFRGSRTVYSDDYLDVRCASVQHDRTRLLLIISRFIGNAVTRNLLRRRLKAIFREISMDAPPFNQLVIITKKPLSMLSFSTLKQKITDLYKTHILPFYVKKT